MGKVCFVTGGSGFIGANLVHELAARGHRVKVLLRPGCDRLGLQGTDFEPVIGHVGDVEVLKHGLRGCDWCFHLAASYHLWLKDYGPMYAANVEGTRNVLEAAAKVGCSRIVHTSTVGCIGLPAPRNGHTIPSDETIPLSETQLANHYKRSKWQAEQVANAFVRQGCPVIIVNPTAPVGPRDVKPTPTGRVIVDFLNQAMPAYLDTGLNWVHVRDVAVGHILAAERGKIGERYILGNTKGNWTMRETFAALEEVAGVPAPRVRVPYVAAWFIAQINEALARRTGRPPRAPLAGVRMAKFKMFFTPEKAIRELDLPQTSPIQGLAEAVDWFRNHGYAGQGLARR